MSKTSIRTLRARQILDSRGRPTVEVDVELEDGTEGRASVPSGASTGAAEAHELRDGDKSRYEGRGVLQAVAHVNDEIAARLRGSDAMQQNAIDATLLELDGTPQLKRLGANAILGSSLAICRAAAASARQPLYQRIAELSDTARLTMPMPMVNILSGGLHAGRGMDVQDFLAIPASAQSINEAIHLISRVRSAATEVMQRRGLSTLLADEGGLSPGFETGREALQLMVEATEHAGLQPGKDIVIAIDVAASSLKGPNGTYRLAREGRNVTSEDMIAMLEAWVSEFPIISIEDGLDEEDWAGWEKLSARLGGKVRLIGDDLFTTNLGRVRRGIEAGIANGVLVKVNQNGSLSGTLAVIAASRAAAYAPVVSARSGETEDSFIADLAVGSAAGQIKIGSVRCSDRLSKYNQLLRIEEQSRAEFAGMSAITLKN
ncbi:phosphopyruvate hydratase [Noviherbaspirillum sp. Root189]|uniref:phosphopyruvate hydratase n=1 Tax=Noviherbaspirillum sp. Root189 TaxID=1736487 RepID=UPI0007103450|nr:phosphopyruvate hydratase [Noviherbaspirillum sp. Root189]KRB93541.1 enolase [Noviherbaspirillum sp. Root189]